ncbi:MAG: MgtC/SapB family protein [Verrucomicrobia bacterium]|nr:MgtC/SapB family protein [Verrucomicrobiota bacterium]
MPDLETVLNYLQALSGMISPETREWGARLIVAAILGALVGLERDIHGRAAGLRTHLLVCLGAAAFTVVSIYLSRFSEVVDGTVILRADPSRIAAQVVTGIGFLGAGAIIKEGLNVRGLTTAACLWIVAAVGMAAGAGAYTLAVMTTLLSLFALVVLSRVERGFRRDYYRVLRITTGLDTAVGDVTSCVKRHGMRIMHFDYQRDYETSRMTIQLSVRIFHRGITDKLVHGVVDDLENGNLTIHRIEWAH